MCLTAELTSADTESAEYLRLVSYAYLTQFYTSSEYSGKVLYQFTEVHAVLRGEVKEYLVFVECTLNVNEVHFQFAEGNFLLANPESFLFLFFILSNDLKVGFRSKTDYGFKR